MLIVHVSSSFVHNNNSIIKRIATTFTDAAQSETNYPLLRLMFWSAFEMNPSNFSNLLSIATFENHFLRINIIRRNRYEQRILQA